MSATTQLENVAALLKLTKPPSKTVAMMRLEIKALKQQRSLCADDPFSTELVLGGILQAVRDHDPEMKQYAVKLQQKAKKLTKEQAHRSNEGIGTECGGMQGRRR